MDTDFLLDLINIMNEREREIYVPYERRLSLQSLGWASILSSLIGIAKQTKIQWTSYSTKISSIIYPSTADKLIWNKYKFERNRPSMNLNWSEQSVTYNHGCECSSFIMLSLSKPFLKQSTHGMLMFQMTSSSWDHKLDSSQYFPSFLMRS